MVVQGNEAEDSALQPKYTGSRRQDAGEVRKKWGGIGRMMKEVDEPDDNDDYEEECGPDE